MPTVSATTRAPQSCTTASHNDAHVAQATLKVLSPPGAGASVSPARPVRVTSAPPQVSGPVTVLDNVAPADVTMPSQQELNLLLSVVAPATIDNFSKQYHLSARCFGPLLDGHIPRATLTHQDSATLRALLTGSQDPTDQAEAELSQAVIGYLRRCIETAFGVRCPARVSFAASLRKNDARTVGDIEAALLVRTLRQLCQKSLKRTCDTMMFEDPRPPKGCAASLPILPAPRAGGPTWGKASDPRLAPAASTTYTAPAIDLGLATAERLAVVEDLPKGLVGASACTLGQQFAKGCAKTHATLNDHVQLLRIGAVFVAALKSDTQLFITAQQQAYELTRMQVEQRDEVLVDALEQVNALRAQAQQNQQQLDQRKHLLAQTKHMRGL